MTPTCLLRPPDKRAMVLEVDALLPGVLGGRKIVYQ